MLFRFLFVCTVLMMIAVCVLVGVAIARFDRDLPGYQQPEISTATRVSTQLRSCAPQLPI
jgi:hypothetical protein